MFTCRWSPPLTPWCWRDRCRAALTTPSRGLALATPAERLLGSATLGVLLMHQFCDDPRDSVACLAEGSLGGSRGVCHASGELVEAALNAARVTQQRGRPLGGVGSVHSGVVRGHTASLTGSDR